MRLIDADELWDMATKGIPDGGLLYRIPPSLVDKCPTIEAEPVRHGRWIKQIPNHLGFSNYFVCSQCARVTRTRYKVMMCDDPYCKHCGAKMDLKEGVVESG